jgi:hypothetical protein
MAKDYVVKRAGMGGIGLSKRITVSLRFGRYFISVPRSRTEGGEIYQNQDLLIEAGTQFQASGQHMTMELANFDRFMQVLKFLQDELFVTVDVPRTEMDNIIENIPNDIPEVTQMLKQANIDPSPTERAKPNVKVLQLRLKLKAKAALALMKLNN